MLRTWQAYMQDMLTRNCHVVTLMCTSFHFSFNVLPTAAIVKTLVMMAGEIEYENFIYENGEALFGVTGHVMIMGSSGVALH